MSRKRELSDSENVRKKRQKRKSTDNLADELLSLVQDVSVWYSQKFDVVPQNSFFKYVNSQDCKDELYDIAKMSYTPKFFIMALRNPAADVGMIQHLSAEHF